MAWTTPRTWVTSEVVTAAVMNTHVRDNLSALHVPFEAWSTYTPTVSGWTLGSGTVTGRYLQVGSTVHFDIKLTLSSTTVSASPIFTLPSTASSNYSTYSQIGSATFIDASPATTYGGIARLNSTTTVAALTLGTSLVHTNLSTTVPFTWANSDSVTVHGWYEAA